ncbi:hypothetical protein Xen7305DRAFT_00023850 [Xenococcus sp. PCC 7305]|uniref:hypothetical protein n=1 Tax=Xenococcus sp. PCC 7305 TaxID=102125 RepID=UPI0002AC1277|nr:hypothetical protein [Xenococcus sp. PCC 7305]ELS02667.1 hypothetical protein Xen7305DRAFT_00023850 [Xenococcus sp. PCC 7305]
MKQLSFAITTLLYLCLANFPVNVKEALAQNIQLQQTLLAQAEWKLFSFNAEKFQVQFPFEPKIFKDFTDIDGQQLDWYLFRVDDDSYWNPAKKEDDANSVYLVAYTDLTVEYIEQSGNDLLEKISDNLFQEFELEELNQQGKAIFLNGQPGLEFSGNLDDSIAGMRLYLVGQRLYSLYAISDDSTNIEQFFNSFQVQ